MYHYRYWSVPYFPMTHSKRTNQTIAFLAFCSVSLLATVFFFQYELGLTPCKLCIWQRLPHAIVVLLSAFALMSSAYKLAVCFCASLAILVGCLLAGYHVGIEYNFWAGPLSCSSSGIPNTLSPELFLEAILTTPVPRCDEVVWTFLNTSMAGWNLILSILLLILWTLVTFKVFRDLRC